MKVSWHYDPAPKTKVQPDDRYVEDNKLFIHLANIVHESQGVSEDLKHVVDDIFTHCTTEPDIQKIEQKIKEHEDNMQTPINNFNQSSNGHRMGH